MVEESSGLGEEKRKLEDEAKDVQSSENGGHCKDFGIYSEWGKWFGEGYE